MQKVVIGQYVKANTRWGQYKVCDAPNEVIPYAFLIATAKAIASNPARNSHHKFVDAPTIQLGEEFIIDGYGVHRLELARPTDDEVVTVRVADGFKG